MADDGDWRETVSRMYGELLSGRYASLDADVLARRLVTLIETRHHEYFRDRIEENRAKLFVEIARMHEEAIGNG